MGTEKTDAGTSVGVVDPYAHVDRCDHLTDEGRCRFAVEHGDRDSAFADARSAADFRCPVVATQGPDTPTVADEGPPDRGDGAALPGPWAWADCPHFRCRQPDDACVRCGLSEVRLAHDDERPLLEEHHLSYADGDDPGHEITVSLCRWCHATVHDSWGRVDDDASPDAEALAEREARRSREQAELGFDSAADRYDREG